MSYQEVIDKLQENDLSWTEVDRILLNEEKYNDFQDRASFDTSNYETTDAPAVRETEGDEKIIYVAENGMEITINI